MKRVVFTVMIRGDNFYDVDQVTDELMEYVRVLNPKLVYDISVDIFQKVGDPE